MPLPFCSQPLTKSEKSIPGVAELLPWFGEDRSQPLGDGASVHGRLKGAEHEVECVNVIFSFLGNLFGQTAESALIQNGSYTCRGVKRGNAPKTVAFHTGAHPDVSYKTHSPRGKSHKGWQFANNMNDANLPWHI